LQRPVVAFRCIICDTARERNVQTGNDAQLGTLQSSAIAQCMHRCEILTHEVDSAIYDSVTKQ
jgi:hypothetical protein